MLVYFDPSPLPLTPLCWMPHGKQRGCWFFSSNIHQKELCCKCQGACSLRVERTKHGSRVVEQRFNLFYSNMFQHVSTLNVRVALSIPWPSIFLAESHETPKIAVAPNSRVGGPAQESHLVQNVHMILCCLLPHIVAFWYIRRFKVLCPVLKPIYNPQLCNVTCCPRCHGGSRKQEAIEDSSWSKRVSLALCWELHSTTTCTRRNNLGVSFWISRSKDHIGETCRYCIRI